MIPTPPSGRMGRSSAFPGFLRAYEESQAKGKEEKEVRLPDMNEGDVVSVAEIRAEQHFTEPPPRFSEASLVKALEDYGIGRPSTYASIIQTLVRRKYVEMDRRRFIPTDTGRVVARFLQKHFEPYVDYRIHGPDGGHAGRNFQRGNALDTAADAILEAVYPQGQGQGRNRQPSGCQADPGPRQPIPRPARRFLSGWGVSARTRKSAAVDDEEKPQFAGLRKA